MNGHAPPHVAVALHELRRACDLPRERAIPGGAPGDGGEPALHPRVLLVGAIGDRPERTQERQEPDAQVARDGRRADVLAEGRPAARPATLGPARERRHQPTWQDPPDLVEVGLEVVGDDDLAPRHALLHTDPLEPAPAGLQLGDPDRVLVRHPDREAPREEAQQRGVVESDEGAQPHEVTLDVRAVLILGEPFDRLAEHRPELRREARRQPRRVGVGRRRRPARRDGERRRGHARRREALGGGEPCIEAAEVGADLNPFPANRLAERVGADRQRARGGEGPEQDRVRLRPVLARQREGVEGVERARERARRALEVLARVDPAPGHDLLVDRVQAVRARDDRGARGRREAELDHPPDLEELRGEQHVEGAGHRVEREDRRLGVAGVAQLDVVGGRAGPLRDPRDRGPVDRIAVEQRRVHDPVEEDAAPLAADGGDQDAQEPRVAHTGTAARRRITARRAPARTRVQRVGFSTTFTS